MGGASGWIHIILAIPIVGYIYSPFDKIPPYAAPTRYVFLPIMVVTGLWAWKGMSFDASSQRDPLRSVRPITPEPALSGPSFRVSEPSVLPTGV